MLFKQNFIKPHLHPLFFITAAFCAGITTQATHHSFMAYAAFILVASLFFFSKSNIGTKKLLTFGIITAFLCGIALSTFQQHSHRLAQKALCNGPCCIRSTVINIEPSKQKFLNTRITIKIHATKHKNKWVKNNTRAFIYTRKQPNILVGDEIEITDITFKKPNSESFNMYLMRQSVAAVVFEKEFCFTLLNRPVLHGPRFLHTNKKNLHNRLKKKISSKTFSLFSSIFLGNRSEKNYFLDKSKEQFKTWGVLHFLARSGLHLVLFIVLWETVLAYIPLSFFIVQLLLIFLAGLYCAYSWTSTSFIRALSIFFLYKIGPFLNTRTNVIHLLFVVCLAMLIINPVHLLFLDFQLSFGLTFALAWFGHLLRQKRKFAKKC